MFKVRIDLPRKRIFYSELGDMPYPGDSLYIAGPFTDPNVAKKISSVGVSSCADLYCSHE